MNEQIVTAKASRVLAQAAELPSEAEVRALAERAVGHGPTPEMSLEEIKALADLAIRRAGQVASLLSDLSDLLADSPSGGEP